MRSFQSSTDANTRLRPPAFPTRRAAPAPQSTHLRSSPARPPSGAAHRALGYDFSSFPIHAPGTPSLDASGKTALPLPGEESPSEVQGNGGPDVETPSLSPIESETPLPMDSSKTATPPKLSKRDESPAAGTTCGGFKWIIQWVLDKPSPKGGWVVQKVRNSHDIKDCDGKALDASKLPFQLSWYPFWEAWPINKDQKVTTYAEKGDKEDDTFSSGGTGDGTKGTRTITGDAEFYEGLTLPDTFKVTDKAPTFILPTTKSAPTLSGGTGSISHNIKATWNCCDGASKKTTVEPT